MGALADLKWCVQWRGHPIEECSSFVNHVLDSRGGGA